jgi:hypothetical protein
VLRYWAMPPSLRDRMSLPASQRPPAAWLTDALAATPDDIDAALATYEARAKSFGSAMVARARFLGAYLESPPRVGLTPEPIAVMQAIGAPLRDIPELAGAFT